MNSKDFSELLERRIELTRNVLDSKSKEYSSDDDKLHNFLRAARVSGQSASRALNGMLLKHLISYFDMIDKIEEGHAFERAYLDEKFGDIINYFILQEAIFVEYGLKPEIPKSLTESGLNKRYDY